MIQQDVGALSDEKRLLLERYLRGERQPVRAVARHIPQAPPGEPVPLSFEQELIWMHSQLAPELPLYNEILTLRRKGPLDAETLGRAFGELLRRHEAWRTTFDVFDGRPVQRVEPAAAVALPVVDLTDLPAADREREARRLATELVRRPIDLVHGPVCRPTLVRMADDEHRLYVIVHQIVHDGVSVYSVLLPELVQLYEELASGATTQLGGPPVQYADFAYAQRRGHTMEAIEPSLAYWRRQMADAPTALEIPTDFARPSVQTFRGRQHTFTLPVALTHALKRFSQREGVTLYVTLLAAFETLLHRYTGQDDLVVGTAISTRRHPDVDRLLGVFLNTIPLRTRVSETMTFRQLLAAQKELTVEGLSHGDVPFHLLVKDLQPRRDPGRNPLFQVTFVLEPPMPPPMPGWELTQMDVDTGVSRVDLYLQMDDRPEGLVGHIRYAEDLWEHATIVRLAEHLETLLEGVVSDPEQVLAAIPMLTAGERRSPEPTDLLARPSNEFVAFDAAEIEQSIPERFAKVARAHADRVAVRTSDVTWTYAQLDEARRKVSAALVPHAAELGSRVALVLDHDAPMLAGVLGTLTSGCAYVALDPSHPPERLRQIVVDAGVVAVLTSARNRALACALAPDGVEVLVVDDVLRGPPAPAPATERRVPPDTLAYVLYTSGSTGRPKGVAQTQRNVLHFIAAYANNLHLSADDRLTLLPSYCVDAAVMDVFAALLTGATLCPMEVRSLGLRGVLRCMSELRITVHHSTPTLFRHLVRELGSAPAPATVRLVVLGGEEVRRSDVEAYCEHFGPGCVLVNGFGPTESTVTLQYFVDRKTRLDRRAVPIGTPVERTQVALVSRSGVPGQVYGEIAIRSPHVALGYWGCPELTEKVFRDDASGSGRRVYRTGDLGRLLPDGNVEYRGRRDQQTKIQGFRVELGELETALVQHAEVREAAAVVREGKEGEKYLVAYFATRGERVPTPDELRRFLRGRLPIHMIPASFVCVERLPWTTSGKLDRRALPDAEPDAIEARAPVAAEDELEEHLARIWRDVLAVPRVGVEDDFFELGGHSMTALRMMARIDDELGVGLTLGTLFEAPTVRRLADVLRPDLRASRRPRGAEPPAPTPRGPGFLEKLRLIAARARWPR
ncbi:MAG TPA: amino acid adenylation domain-containing protein [Polyangiaceae bacterium]|jgi:amino acid adenylation domain-containing protein